MTSHTVEIREMPREVIPEVEKIATWLRSGSPTYQQAENVRICQSLDELDDKDKLKRLFLNEIKKGLPNGRDPSDSHMYVIHYQAPALVPLGEGWIMELIPLYTVKGPVRVGGKELSRNSYFHLTARDHASGDFYAAMIIFKI
ncbi:hypothetical protein O1611_g726 [Lasiodiplodia mahajangana]|uniref:Uncharacterized protein n=1 Tax=Lasiodiplodia mahajangana TaxID=1108764 RepID=A0ACC2JZI5_9PEZI|nr:hypothetical protein O1611_g726 [Lasiodiplodia mahajangana]